MADDDMSEDNDSPMQTQPDEDNDDRVLLGDEEESGLSEDQMDKDAALREQGLIPGELTEDEEEELLADTDAGEESDEDSGRLSDVTTPEEAEDN